jgi:hypothetical protein
VEAVEVKYVNATVAIDGDVWDAVKVGNYGERFDRARLEDARGRTPSVRLNEAADALVGSLERFGKPVHVERVVLMVHPKARVVRHSRPTVVVGTLVDAALGRCRARRVEIARH